MLFPLHELPHTPARVQIGFLALILGVAWLASGQLLRSWSRKRDGSGSLRAFAANRDWRWIGAILMVGGLCIARPWGIESGPFVWVRHTALLLVVLLVGEFLSVRQKTDRWLGLCLVASLLVYCGMALRVAVRFSMPDLAGAGFFSTPWLNHGLFAALISVGVVAMVVGCWRILRHLREVAPLHALALVLMLPMFAEGTMFTGAIDRYSREASHSAAIDAMFGEDTMPAGIYEIPPLCAGEEVETIVLGDTPMDEEVGADDSEGSDHSGCHSCPMP
ncbi:MAG: hypothetical protein ACKO2G_15805 [Verrucomicrobiales bacterium]